MLFVYSCTGRKSFLPIHFILRHEKMCIRDRIRVLTGILYMYMKLVVLDGYTENPGDLDWRGMEALGDLTVYARTDHSQVKERMQDADAVIINKVPMTRELMQESKQLRYIGVLATGYDVVDIEAARDLHIEMCIRDSLDEL